MSAIQNTYEQVPVGLSVDDSVDEIDDIQYSTLSTQKQLQMQIESFCSCLELLNL
jgi:hypothetical protein